MKFKFSWSYLIAFIALNMVFAELHEEAHILTGYFICGCYGPRDFNVWATCTSCAHPAWAFGATLAGPLFSCSLMWLGAFWFSKCKDRASGALGFSLLFANLPFARILTALLGGGDEKVVLQNLLGSASPLTVKLSAILLVSAICLPPVLIALKNLANRKRAWIVTAFLLLPLVFGQFYHHLFLNWLLKKGVAADTHLLGTPDLVLLHGVLMLLLLFYCRNIFERSFIPERIRREGRPEWTMASLWMEQYPGRSSKKVGK